MTVLTRDWLVENLLPLASDAHGEHCHGISARSVQGFFDDFSVPCMYAENNINEGIMILFQSMIRTD